VVLYTICIPRWNSQWRRRYCVSLYMTAVSVLNIMLFDWVADWTYWVARWTHWVAGWTYWVAGWTYWVGGWTHWVPDWTYFWTHWGTLSIEWLYSCCYDYYCLLHQRVSLALPGQSLMCCSERYCWLFVVWLRWFWHCSCVLTRNCFCFLLILDNGRPCSLCSLQSVCRCTRSMRVECL
jgi:hypothetical protein